MIRDQHGLETTAASERAVRCYDDMILHTVVAYWYDDGQLRSRIEYAKLKCH